MRYALFDAGGDFAAAAETDDETRLPHAGEGAWVASAAAGPGWRLAGGMPVAPAPQPAPTQDAGQALAAARGTALRAVNARRDGLLAAGFQRNFGGQAGIRTLDMRGADDAAAWQRLKTRATDAIASGSEGAMLEVIDAGDAIFATSADTLDAALTELFAWRDRLQLNARRLKNAVLAAETPEAVAAVAIEDGWA